MEEIKVCIMCLLENVKMYKLEGNLLENYFKHVLAGLDVKNNLQLPLYACYECVYYIQKYCAFREKCLRGYSVLLEIYEKNTMVTENCLKAIDRLELELCSKLVSNGPIIYNMCNETEHVDVKMESSTDNISDVQDISISVEINELKTENYVKIEDGASVLDSTDVELSTEEPISERKVLKRLKRKKVLVKKLQTRKKSEDNNQKSSKSLNKCTTKPKRKGKDAETDLEIKQPRKRPVPKCKPNRKPSIKDNVTVVKLSIEEQLEEVTKRQHSSNYLKAVFKCALCYKGFLDPDAFERHMKRHDPISGPFTCPICKVCFPMSSVLKRHINMHENNYICKTCSYVCKTLDQAKQHQNEHKGKVYHCEHCGNLSTKLSSHLTHLRVNHPSDFVCDICGYAFVSKVGLKQHRLIMHKDEPQSSNINKQMRYCTVCDLQSNSLPKWKRHIASIGHKIKENKDLTCTVCGEAQKSGRELRLHHYQVHTKRHPLKTVPKATTTHKTIELDASKATALDNRNPSWPRVWPAKCLHCDEQMLNGNKYFFHFRRAHPDKQYPNMKDHICDICGKSYKCNALLMCHRRTHSEDPPLKCSQCPKAFFNRFNLLLHEKSHSEDRPFACASCTKAFKSKGALGRHSLCHTGEKPYVCQLCGKAFSQSNSCNVHVKTVHLKQPAPYVSRTRLKKRRPHAQAASPTVHSDDSIY